MKLWLIEPNRTRRLLIDPFAPSFYAAGEHESLLRLQAALAARGRGVACRFAERTDIWERDPIEESLITVPSNEFITRTFQVGLAKLGVDWFSRIEVSSVELVQTYVANRYGIGVTVDVPRMKLHPQVRVLPLDGFEPVQFGALWQGGKNPLLDAFLKIVQATVRRLLAGENLGL